MGNEAFGGVLSSCRTAACGQKKIASDFVSAGGLQPPCTKGLSDHVAPYHGRISHARVAAKLVALVHLVSLVYLVQPNKRDKPNKPEQPIRSLSQKLAAMGSGEILVGTKGDDSSRIDVVVSDVVVPLDVVEVHGVGDAVGLIEVFQVAEEVWVIDDSPEVALEMAMIDGVEAHKGDEQAPIGFDEL